MLLLKTKEMIASIFSSKKDIITLHPKDNVEGRVLLSYLLEPFSLSEDSEKFNAHSNYWESKEIVKIFNKLGFIVDIIDWTNDKFYPEKKYDVIFDIGSNLQKIAPFLDKKTIKILHITGSYPYYSIKSELKRVAALEKRKGVLYSPKRVAPHPELFERSIRIADICSLIGNKHTLKTFPSEYRNKINLVTVSVSKLKYIKTIRDYMPLKKEFLWFFGGGAVHKGLDLVLEVFAKNKNLTLNVVSSLDTEKDFLKIYDDELTKLPNIKYHGFLIPESEDFINIIKNCFCFIAPSCSEGTSAAVATCLQAGLLPIISKDTGVSLPQNCGLYLSTCSIEEIERAVIKAHNFSKDYLENQIGIVQAYALKKFSRDNFTEDMTNFIKKALNMLNKG